MTPQEAEQILKENGWCYAHTHPYSGAYDQIQVGPRGDTESYGPFPQGWVDSIWGVGNTMVEAVEKALEHKQAKEAVHAARTR